MATKKKKRTFQDAIHEAIFNFGIGFALGLAKQKAQDIHREARNKAFVTGRDRIEAEERYRNKPTRETRKAVARATRIDEQVQAQARHAREAINPKA